MPEQTAVPRTPQQAKWLAEVRRTFRKSSDAWAREQGYTHRITETGSMQPLGSLASGPSAPNGRAPREATNDRQRGSRRGDRATSSSSDDPGDEGPSDEPPPRRLCENRRCEADISHRPVLARYCDDACQQEAYRDRRTLELLDELTGTIAEGLSCVCSPSHNVTEHEHCLKCGYPRDAVTREWVIDPAPSSRQLVVLGSMSRKPRSGDGKRKPVTKKRTVPMPKRVAA